MIRRELAYVLCALALATACSSPAEGPADPGAGSDYSGAASLRGAITAIDGNSIRVEEEPAAASGSAKAVVRITAETVIRRGNLPSAPADLTVGDTVDVWFTGPVAESYPVQAAAGVVEIISAGR